MAASRYHEVYRRWQDDPEAFWAEAADDLHWDRRWDRVFDADQGVYGRWFVGAECNMCFNAVDRHVEGGRADQLALIYDSPITGRKQTFTYAEVKAEVEALAAVLADSGIGKGDRVIVYMPMVPEAAWSMLACARLGAIHSVVFGGFAAKELATRIDDAKPKLIISASCGLEPGRIIAYKPLLDRAIDLSSHKPDATIILQRPEETCSLTPDRDLDYAEVVGAAKAAKRKVDCVPVEATHPLYLLYTSGTTGQPKGVVRDTGGHMVALNWSMGNEFGVKPGEVFWAASDVGWVVGHSYIVYGPLIYGATSILFEGKPVGTPDAGTFWRVIAEHGVVAQFTAPTAFRAIKKEDPNGEFVKKYDLSRSGRCSWPASAPIPTPSNGGAPTGRARDRPLVADGDRVADQPESGRTRHLPVKYGSPCVAMPGYDIRVLDDAGHEVTKGTLGNVVVKLPLPPGCLPTLWNADQRFRDAYLSEFPGYYKTADAGFIDDDGYLFIMARTDDIINVAGHRLSTAAWKKSSPNIRTSPSVPWWASPMR